MNTTLDSLIKSALDEAFVKVNNLIPKTKTIEKENLVSGMTVQEIYNYCKNNNLPLSSEIYTNDDGDMYISQTLTVPMTDKDIADVKRKKFETLAWKLVFDSLTANGYKRKPLSSSFFKKFDGISLYERYVNGDFENLIEFYSAHFGK